MQFKLLIGLLLLNLSACFSSNVIKNLSTNNETNTNAKISTMVGAKNSVDASNTPSNNNLNPLNPNVNPISTPTPSQGYSNTSGGFSGGGGISSTPMTKEEIIAVKKTEVSKKISSIFKGEKDKSREIIILQMLGFSADDLQKAGYSKEDIDLVITSSSPSPK